MEKQRDRRRWVPVILAGVCSASGVAVVTAVIMQVSEAEVRRIRYGKRLQRRVGYLL